MQGLAPDARGIAVGRELLLVFGSIDWLIAFLGAYSDEASLDELIEARNQADGLIHGIEKSMRDLGDKVTEDEKKPIDDAIAELREALESDDKDDIEAKTQKLSEASAPVMEKAYSQSGEAEGGAEDGEQTKQSSQDDSDDVVDADFEEVKDDDKKSGTNNS